MLVICIAIPNCIAFNLSFLSFTFIIAHIINPTVPATLKLYLINSLLLLKFTIFKSLKTPSIRCIGIEVFILYLIQMDRRLETITFWDFKILKSFLIFSNFNFDDFELLF